MSDVPPEKKYDTNPLDQDVYRRAEAEMGSFESEVESESPTRPMSPETAEALGTERQGIAQPTGFAGYQPGYSNETYGRPTGSPTYSPPQPVQYGGGWMAQPQQQPAPSNSTSPFCQFKAVGSAHFGLQPNFAAMLCYLPFIGIIASFLLNQYEPVENRFVKYHARQGVFAHVAFWAVAIAISVGRAGAPGPLAAALILPQAAFYIAAVWGFVALMVKTYRGEWVKIPIIGDQIRP